jgi:hypothetical protein
VEGRFVYEADEYCSRSLMTDHLLKAASILEPVSRNRMLSCHERIMTNLYVTDEVGEFQFSYPGLCC